MICASQSSGTLSLTKRTRQGADLAARPANPITLCDDRSIDFVTVAGHIPMARPQDIRLASGRSASRLSSCSATRGTTAGSDSKLSTVYQITPPRPEWQPHFQVRVLSEYQPRLRHVHLPRTLRPDLRRATRSAALNPEPCPAHHAAVRVGPGSRGACAGGHLARPTTW